VINPQTVTVAAGGSVQVPATVYGYGTCSSPTLPTQPCAGSPATYSAYVPTGITGVLGNLDPNTGVYTPAATNPASEVNVTAQSAFSPNVTAVGVIELQQ